jgi:hypothetical protein
MFGTGSPPRAILASIERRNLSAQPLDSRGQPWLLEAADWRAVLRYLPPRRYPPAECMHHMKCLHRFLDRLAPLQVATPRPLRELGGASIAVADGALWELLSYVPGRALGFDPRVPLESAGGLLASFHLASRQVPTPEQRPGALPLEDCRPSITRHAGQRVPARPRGSGPGLGRLVRIACRLHRLQHTGVRRAADDSRHDRLHARPDEKAGRSV